jgi:hypothetical protein
LMLDAITKKKERSTIFTNPSRFFIESKVTYSVLLLESTNFMSATT